MSNGWRGGSTTRWRELRAYVLQRDHYRCRIGTEGVCTRVATDADHIIPVAAGGVDHETNLRAACGPCNRHRWATRDRAPQPEARPVSRW